MNREAGIMLGVTPADVANLPREVLPGLLTEMQAIERALLARLMAPAPEPNSERSHDEHIPVDEAARIACVPRERILRSPVFKPARVKLGHKTVVVNERKLRRILAERAI